jgi:hypothetical protein
MPRSDDDQPTITGQMRVFSAGVSLVWKVVPLLLALLGGAFKIHAEWIRLQARVDQLESRASYFHGLPSDDEKKEPNGP